MKLLLIAAIATIFSLSPATAADISTWYHCSANQSPERLIKSLIEGGSISRRPYEGHDSVDYFKASAHTKAFGFPLVAIKGAELGSTFFHRAPGTGASSQIGLVVQAQQGKVQTALREKNLNFFTSKAVSQRGAAIFVESFEDFLPDAADKRLAYTMISCYPDW